MTSTVSIVGSTGSIGTQAIDVVLANPEKFQVIALGAHSSVDKLVEQARIVEPKIVAIGDASLAQQLQSQLPGMEVRAGAQAMESVSVEADVVGSG